MILIGQYDSPFVRRVGIAMRLYGIPFEHRPWSTFGDGDKVATFNPLRRVPTLVLDDGEVLIESGAILDHLDETIGPERALIPARAEFRDFWRDSAMCAETTMPTDPDPCVAYDACASDTPVHYCQHDGDHVWTSFGTEATWAFFKYFTQ